MTMSRLADGLIRHDGVVRCWWCGDHPDYQHYHDAEWGRPVSDDRLLFEKMSLEGFQSGLSWLTILRKRENFRRAFDGFDHERIARWRPAKVEELLQDAGIVRHRGKIEAVVNNARAMRALVDECGSLADFVWRYAPDPSTRPRRMVKSALMELAQTAESRAMAKELKRRGFRFFGPTTAYAFMQAMGLVNDHLEGCHARPAIEQARVQPRRPA
jgi:DNA-3-methyladenine glycosylase I